jgi:hypothetical protein
VALSFLYIGFVPLIQLTRLCRRGQEELTIEIVVLRQEVSVRSIVTSLLRASTWSVPRYRAPC